MANTTYLNNKLLDHVHGKTSYTAPTVYIGLSTTTPAVAGTGVTEPSGNAYARVATSAATWGSAASGATTNAAAITFPTATGSWGTVTYAVAYDASSGGNLLWFASIGSQAISSGTTPYIAIGDADTSLT
jgi:hypothetical protein